MSHTYSWKKKNFSDLYTLFRNDRQVGTFSNKSFSNTAYGELNGHSYAFRSAGLFNRETQVIDTVSNTVIGNITYSNWKRKATIQINGQSFELSFNTLWNNHWIISNEYQTLISCQSSSTSGTIQSDIDHSLLILCGLSAAGYYSQTNILVILFVVFIPIIAAQH